MCSLSYMRLKWFMSYIRIFILAFLFLAFVPALHSQPCFERAFGGTLNEEASLVRPTFDHGYVLIGSRDDTTHHTRAYYVLKLDSTGREEWSKSYGDAFNQYGSSIVQTRDSGYAFVGSHDAALYNAVAEVVRISPTGTLIDSKTYPPFDGWATQGIGIISTADSNLAISTYTDGFISQNYYSLFKLKNDLSIKWSNFVSFDGSVMNEHDAAQGTNDRFYTLGHYSNFYYSTPPAVNVTEVRQFDSNGIQLIDSLYQWNTVSNSISSTREGGMIICGDKDSLSNKDIALTLLDSSGAVIWQKSLGSSRNESGRHARQTKDGGYVILCSVPHLYFPLLNDIVLMKVNAQGDSLWSRTFGATFDDVAIHMQETYDGGFIILGRTNSFDSSHIYLIKTDSMGIISSPYKIRGPGNYFCKGDTVQLFIDPAPASGCTVQWSNSENGDTILTALSGNYTATITDSSGLVYTTPNYFLFFATLADARLSQLDTIGICTGARLQNLAPASLSFSYSWYLDDTLISSVRTNYIKPSRTGKYMLRVDNYCGSDSDTVILDTLYNLPAIPVLNVTGNKFICQGDSLQLFIPDDILMKQWWYAQTGNAQPVTGANDTAFMARTEGIYFVQVTDSNGCNSFSNPLNIFIDNYAAYVNTSGPLSFCQGGHVILSAPSGSDYLWNTGDTVNSLFINTSGDFWYSMTSMFGCPKNSDTVSTEAYLKPYINLGPDTTVCNDQSYLIDAGPGYNSYLWQDGSANQVYLAATASPGPDSGLYYVIVTDVNACSNADSVKVYFDICQGTNDFYTTQNSFLYPSILSAGDMPTFINQSQEKLNLEICNYSGQIIYSNVFPEGIFRINLVGEVTGFLVYTIKGQDQIFKRGKLVIETR